MLISKIVTLACVIILVSCSDEIHNTTPSWTIMVYMDGDNDLEQYALFDFNEMESVNLLEQKITIIILFDRCNNYSTLDGDWKGTRLYKVLPDSNISKINSERLIDNTYLHITNTGDSDELNMGDPNTLNKFISFCKANYPADYYSLIIWNHGTGWRTTSYNNQQIQSFKAVCLDVTNSNDILMMSEVKQALKDKELTLIGFDACLMSMIEVAYQMKDCANYMVASEDLEPANGWAYDYFLTKFIMTNRSPVSLGQSIIAGYANEYTNKPITMLDLRNIDILTTSIDDLCTDLILNISSIRYSIAQARDNSLFFQNTTSPPYSYMDFYDFLVNISSISNITNKVLNCMLALEYTVVYHYQGAYSNSHGLSIYFPQSTSDSEYQYYNITNIDFAQTSWDDFLNSYFNN
ncbi:MAG: clostripain-related cysteine peptidase [Spirochaetes bacterium]|nr:clostripain-related cysteine peptidase [Spirochaetota bacterium]